MNIKSYIRKFVLPPSEYEKSKILLGQIRQAQIQSVKKFNSIIDLEFSVFSSAGEDGIIAWFVDNIPFQGNHFIEFGVQDFFQSNCRFLMHNRNWSGYVIDGSRENINNLKKSWFYWQYDLKSSSTFLTKENINKVLNLSNFNKNEGIISIDVDGVDYFLLKEMTDFFPEMYIIEYNSLFGNDRPISVEYDENFDRFKKHYSGLFFGASMKAFENLLTKRGYFLLGSNSVGSNLFFLRQDLVKHCEDKFYNYINYFKSKYREARMRQNKNKLSLLSHDEGLSLIKGNRVLNTITNQIELL